MVTFTEEVVYGKLYFLCSVYIKWGQEYHIKKADLLKINGLIGAQNNQNFQNFKYQYRNTHNASCGQHRLEISILQKLAIQIHFLFRMVQMAQTFDKHSN